MKKELTQMQATIITWILMVVMIVSFMLLVCISCSAPKQTTSDMQYGTDTIVTRAYIDSVCLADTLAQYPREWVYSPMRSYEDKTDISTYGWMKSSNWTFYRVIQKSDSTFRFTKRTVK